MIGQELQLEEQQQQNGGDHQADQRDQPQEQSGDAIPHIGRAREKLHEDVGRQSSSQLGSLLSVADLTDQPVVVRRDLVGQHDEVQQHVNMNDQKQRGAEREEPCQREHDIDEWQRDPAVEEQVPVRHAANGDRQVGQHRQVAEPQPVAD